MASIHSIDEGLAPDGEQAFTWLLKTKTMEAKILSWGATLTQLKTMDRLGRLGDIILGFDEASQYFKEHPYFGSTIGRYSNRIRNGRFQMNDVPFQLNQNQPPHHLHGGDQGFDKVSWSGEGFADTDQASVKLRYTSIDGEQGYPGTLEANVTYKLKETGELSISYEAKTDRPTIVNLTNHSYFNLSNGGRTQIGQHEIKLFADSYVVTDGKGIPTGEISPVPSPLDFSHRSPLSTDGKSLELDQCYAVKGTPGTLRPAATVWDSNSGRQMEVWTTQPGIQLYTGQFINPGLLGREGIGYGPNHGFCLEAQNFPDAPNQSHFPNPCLNPGEKYQETIVFRFPFSKDLKI